MATSEHVPLGGSYGGGTKYRGHPEREKETERTMRLPQKMDKITKQQQYSQGRWHDATPTHTHTPTQAQSSSAHKSGGKLTFICISSQFNQQKGLNWNISTLSYCLLLSRRWVFRIPFYFFPKVGFIFFQIQFFSIYIFLDSVLMFKLYFINQHVWLVESMKLTQFPGKYFFLVNIIFLKRMY